MIKKPYVEKLFGYLSHDYPKFFEQVSDQVNWTVMGTHPLAGVYHDKETFIAHTFNRLSKIMIGQTIGLDITHIYVDETQDTAIVEMHANSTLLNNKPFDNYYCWVVRFEGETIVEVRAYLDSALVAESLAENET